VYCVRVFTVAEVGEDAVITGVDVLVDGKAVNVAVLDGTIVLVEI
jgi:hypothetical protein